MKRLVGASTIVLALTLSVAAGPTNLVVNGGFETSPDPNSPPGYVYIPSGATTVDGWTISGPEADAVDIVADTRLDVYEGRKCLDLNGTSPGWISQTIATQVGQWYELSFALSGNPDGPGTKDVAVTAGPVNNMVFSFTSLNAPRDMMWEIHTLLFQADSTTSEIRFQSMTPPELGGRGPYLDDIRVVSTVPVPSGMLLAGLGVAVVGWMRGRRLA